MTLPLYHPFAFGLVVGAPVTIGFVLSILTRTLSVAVLSALSVAVPLKGVEPSAVADPPPVHDLTPESPSEQVNETVTFVLFQPKAFGAGASECPTVGACLSSLTVTEPLPVLPRRSAAVELNTVPVAAVFEFSVFDAGVGPDAMPEPASVADHVTDTLLLFQPAAFGAGETAPVTVGPVLSRMNAADCGLCD